jgi:hypothetical protein
VIDRGQRKYFGMTALDADRLAVVSRPVGPEDDSLIVFDRATSSLWTGLDCRVAIPTKSLDPGLITSSPRPGDLARDRDVVAQLAVDDHVNSIRADVDHIDIPLHRLSLDPPIGFRGAGDRRVWLG